MTRYQPSENCHVDYMTIVYWAEFASQSAVFKEVKKQCERLAGIKKTMNATQAAAFMKIYFINWKLNGSFEITPRLKIN